MSTLKISYNGSEISSVDATSPVSVTYNNSTIATLNDGDTKTLRCNGKVMESNVDIGGKILNCNGKLMQGDIVVELVGSAPSGGETWYFNETLNYSKTLVVKDGLTVNGIHYSWCNVWKSFSNGTPTFTCYPEEYNSNANAVHLYKQKQGGWQNDAYRTIIFDNPQNGDFLEWLQNNATKIS